MSVRTTRSSKRAHAHGPQPLEPTHGSPSANTPTRDSPAVHAPSLRDDTTLPSLVLDHVNQTSPTPTVSRRDATTQSTHDEAESHPSPPKKVRTVCPSSSPPATSDQLPPSSPSRDSGSHPPSTTSVTAGTFLSASPSSPNGCPSPTVSTTPTEPPVSGPPSAVRPPTAYSSPPADPSSLPTLSSYPTPPRTTLATSASQDTSTTSSPDVFVDGSATNSDCASTSTPHDAPRTTADLVCRAIEREQASIVRLDPWVCMDVIDRIYKLCDYKDLSSTSFSISNIPTTATWGSQHACRDRSAYVCIDNEPVIAWVTGTVAKKWFTDYQGTPQSPVKLAVYPARSLDLAAANHWLAKANVGKPPSSNSVWASKLMLEWSSDPDVEKPDVIHFTDIYDATDKFSCHEELPQKTSRFFKAGDIVLMEFYITRYKPKGAKSADWKLFHVGFELVAVDVIARHPSYVHETTASAPSTIKRRMVNI